MGNRAGASYPSCARDRRKRRSNPHKRGWTLQNGRNRPTIGQSKSNLESELSIMPYLTNRQYSAQKAALTRAIKTRDPVKVRAACEKAVREWNVTCWPDEWHRWQNALYDISGYRAPDITDPFFAA